MENKTSPVKYRPPVFIEESHEQDYIDLVINQRVGVNPATRIVQKKYDLPQPHRREAVRSMLNRRGYTPPFRRGRQKEESTTGPKTKHARIDHQRARELMLVEGNSQAKVAKMLGCAEQSLTPDHQKLIAEGKLAPVPGGRPKGIKSQPSLAKKIEIMIHSDDEFLKHLKNMTLEEVDDKTLKILRWAIKYPELTESVNRLQNMVHSRDYRIKELEEADKKEKQREQKVQLVQGRQVIHGD